MKLHVFLIYLYCCITWGCTQNITSRPLMKFGPLALAGYEDVGSQEVVFIQVPQKYMPYFAFEWAMGITTSDGSSAKSCPNVIAMTLVRTRGIPIPNPLDNVIPHNTWIVNQDTISGNFEITSVIPDQDKYIMIFNDTTNSTGEYYVSSFLVTDDGQDVSETIPGHCKYVVQLSVLSLMDISAVNGVNHLEPISVVKQVESDFHLERYRDGLLSTDYLTAKEGYSISMTSSTKFSWVVKPYSDVGGTLKITMGFNLTDSLNGTVIIKGCNTWAANGTSPWEQCDTGHLITVNSSESKSVTWYWPFPKSGLWLLEIGTECADAPCDPIHTINLDVKITQCIDNCHKDKSQGDCKIYRTDVLFFSACDCKGGWQGIGCTDGSKAVPRNRQLLMTLLLTLSNLIFLPCWILAAVKHYYSEAAVYAFVMFFSTFYHACDNDFAIEFCLLPYNTLQYSDFYGSITAMWVTLIAVAKLPFQFESFFHMAGILLIGVAVTYNRFSVFTTLIPVLCGLLILAVKWGRECRVTHKCYPDKRDWLLSIVPGSVCAIVGFILFAFVETNANYFYVHSMWHVCMGCAILFLLPKEKKRSWTDDQDLISNESVSVTGTHYNNAVGCDVTTTFHLELSDDSS